MNAETTQPVAKLAAGAAGESPKIKELGACWQQIGVYGNGTCGELTAYIHCRNCPVYAAAAQCVLDRPLPENYRHEWSSHFALKTRSVPPVRTAAIVFRVQTEWLALPAATLQEVGQRRAVHTLPHRRKGIVLGVVNVRGELLICVSLAGLLGIDLAEPALPNPAARLLVTHWEGRRLAFPVDEVHGIHKFEPAELRAPPSTVSKANLTFSKGIFSWRGHPVGFLDPGRVFPAFNQNLA
jgi:chemotaxis-related protein WspD